jgi:hypothetical protein
MVVGQKIALGRIHKHQTVAVLVSSTTLAVEFADGDVRVIRRTTTQPVRSIKRPAAADVFWRLTCAFFRLLVLAGCHITPENVLYEVEST